MKELKTGDWCYAGRLEYKERRIYIDTFGLKHICVYSGYEQKYLNGELYDIHAWEEVHPIEDEPEFTYPMWFKDIKSELVVRFDDLTCGEVIIGNYAHDIGTYVKSWYPHTDTNEWEQVSEPQIFYQWEKVFNGKIINTGYITDEYAFKNEHSERNGWTKVESSRRVV
jgi:hypothetical protein